MIALDPWLTTQVYGYFNLLNLFLLHVAKF